MASTSKRSVGENRVDSVALIMAQWHRERPELGTRVPSIVARILRLANHLRKRADVSQAALGLTWDVAEVIIVLRRSGAPFEMTPTALYKSMLLTSGAITSRLDRAEAAGLVRRTAATTDRRSIKVRLTAAGRTMADKAVTLYYAEMQTVLDTLRVSDADRLAGLLAELLLGIETLSTDEPDADEVKSPRPAAAKTLKLSSKR